MDRNEREDIKRRLSDLNARQRDLLRQAQQCQTDLTVIRRLPGREQTRAALVDRMNDLHGERGELLDQIRDLGGRLRESHRAASLGFMAGVSPTAQLREAARRTGILENLFVDLCRGADGDFADDFFDWRVPLAKARKKLGERPVLDDKTEKGDGE